MTTMTTEEYVSAVLNGIKRLAYEGISPVYPESFDDVTRVLALKPAPNAVTALQTVISDIPADQWPSVEARVDAILRDSAEWRRKDKLMGLFTIDGASNYYFAVRFGERWNGWATPIVTREVFTKLIDDINVGGPYYNLAWYGPTAIFTQLETSGGDQWVDVIPADDEGLYDLGVLGWTFYRDEDFK